MDRNTISEELLARYFSGRCDAEERKKVLAYLSSQDEHASKLMEDEWRTVEENPPPRDQARERTGYEKVAKALAGSSAQPLKFSMPLRVAASLILVATFTFLFYRFSDHLMVAFSPVAQKAVSTGPGTLERIILPDGSVVWLNASSRLSFPERFGRTREVLLEGEAFFEVKENKKKPFIIHTENFFTTVLGTSFNIKAYREDRQIRVSVATGKVSVSVADSVNEAFELAKLTRDQQVTYFPETKSFRTESVLPDQFRGWINRQLVFKKTDVMEVASTLARWYNKRIVVTGALPGERCTFTANFKTGTTLQDVLETLSITQKMTYSTKEDGKVVISVEKCSKQ